MQMIMHACVFIDTKLPIEIRAEAKYMSVLSQDQSVIFAHWDLEGFTIQRELPRDTVNIFSSSFDQSEIETSWEDLTSRC